jgi:hypothetical protein
MFSHPFWYKRNRKKHHDFGSMAVADAVGDTFQPQQLPLRIPQYYTNPIYQPTGTITDIYLCTWDNHRYGTGLSQETILIKSAIYYATINHDNNFLDEKLEQLRNIDSFHFHIPQTNS